MQPDLLFPQREEERPESLFTQDPTQSKSLSISDAAPVAPRPMAEVVAPTAMPAREKKSTKINIAVIGLSLLVFVLFLAFGWVGYWSYTLNGDLTSTQQQLAALQAKHEKLQADYTTLTGEKENLNADLLQSRTDLEKANSDLASAQADLSESKQNGEKLQTQIEKASDLVEILYVTTTLDEETDVFKIDRLITESNNPELIKQWDTFTGDPSDDAFSAFLDYLVLAARNSLK